MLLRLRSGEALDVDATRWHGDLSAAEHALLDGLPAPVLDVGCGPGRVVIALGSRGVPALGVDSAPGAVYLARHRGALALRRSVFDPLPGEGRWGTVVLLDGNVGIGGDPVRLLTRCGHLMAPHGTVVAEVEPPGHPSGTHIVRLEQGGETSAWFPWATVGADAIGPVAAAAGLVTEGFTQFEGRWFAHLHHAHAAA